jgi:hypothetical protein
MNGERLKFLEQAHDENPDDPFTIYALALEFIDSNPDRARQFFQTLLDNFADYLPTYYQAVNFFVNREELATAISIGRKGIEKAKNANEIKTLNELRSLVETIADD